MSKEKEQKENEEEAHEKEEQSEETSKAGAVSSLKTMFARRKSVDKGGKAKHAHQLARKDRAKTLATGIHAEILEQAQQIAQRTEEERQKVEEEARKQEEENEREEARKAQ